MTTAALGLFPRNAGSASALMGMGSLPMAMGLSAPLSAGWARTTPKRRRWRRR
ncbi:MAG: hypothetical protein AB7H90_18415 [Alphaproteobacteria bacterium]